MTKAKASQIEILQSGNPILRKVSSAIPNGKITGSEIKKTISLLKEAIDSQIDAAAISAIQIGTPARLFIVSKKVFDSDKKNTKENKAKNDLIFINPKIKKVSKNKQVLEEGCLSVRYVYGKVSRPEKVTIEACDENGKKFCRGFSGLLAQIVQHENDHLDGILFTDKATDVQKISKEDYEKMLKDL
jgi:peptide deformylase